MAVYFASDIHLRLDEPDRGRRFAQWVGGLRPDDTLYLVGDVCDFWFASRQRRDDPMDCQGLRSLVAFRSRGGTLTVLTGNHDLWLGPFYQRVFGATLEDQPLIVEAYGKRLHVTHGHRAGGTKPWKAMMESRAFLHAFGLAPAPVAAKLGELLEERNLRDKAANDLRLLATFHQYLATIDPSIDIAVFGHLHQPVDDPTCHPRMVVLGDWLTANSYLRLDEAGASLVVEPLEVPVPA